MAQKLGEREMRTATRSSERLKELIGQTRSADRTRGRRLQLPGESRDSERELAAINQEIRQLEHELHKERADKNRKRQKRRRKKQQSMAEDIFKLSALLIGLVLLVVFCIHDGAYDDFDIERSASYQSVDKQQSTFVQQYLAYQDGTTGNNKTVPRADIDTSEWYVDANALSYVDGTTVSPGVVVSKNGPNVQPTDTAYILNITKPYTMIYEDIIAVEQANGSTVAYEDVSAYVKEQMRIRNIFGYQNNNRNDLGGAVAPGIMMRDWPDKWNDIGIRYDGPMWKPHGSTFNKGWSPVDINLMFVTSDDYDKYVAGEQVDIWYVRWAVRDAKAHSAPWGYCQTYCSLGITGSTLNDISYQGPDNDWSYNAAFARTASDTQRDQWAKVIQGMNAAGAVKPYYVERIADSVPYTATTGALPNAGLSAFEYMSVSAYDGLVDWAQSVGGDTMYCVGVFVAEYNP